jgi:hypothetical protein
LPLSFIRFLAALGCSSVRCLGDAFDSGCRFLLSGGLDCSVRVHFFTAIKQVNTRGRALL